MSSRRLACGLAVCVLSAGVLAPPTAAQNRPPHGRLFAPQDLGLLEGPDRDAWQKPDQVMDALLIADGSTVADLGAGGGWFTVRLARRVGPNGVVYAEDIQQQMLEAIGRRVKRENLTKTVKPWLGTGSDPLLPANSIDAVLAVDTYYELNEPVKLLRNIARALKPQGRIGIVDCKKEGGGPCPPLEERVDPEVVIRDAKAAGLRLVSRETFLPFQFLLVFGR